MAGRAAGRAASPLLLCRLRHSSSLHQAPAGHPCMRRDADADILARTARLARRRCTPRSTCLVPHPRSRLYRPGQAQRPGWRARRRRRRHASRARSRPGLASGPVLNSQQSTLVAAYLLACAWAGRAPRSLAVAGSQPAQRRRTCGDVGGHGRRRRPAGKVTFPRVVDRVSSVPNTKRRAHDDC